MSKTLSGATLAGHSLSHSRVAHDFYATPFSTTQAILDRISLTGSILEPAAGQGHISHVLREYYPCNEVVSTELIEREDKFGCDIHFGIDFLTYDYGRKFDNIVTNPPFSLATEFIERALSISNDKVILFAKIQLLEGRKRRKLFDRCPPKYIYVFTNRQSPLNNGSSVDASGKPWATTMCFAWFVWEHNFTGEPVVRWI